MKRPASRAPSPTVSRWRATPGSVTGRRSCGARSSPHAIRRSHAAGTFAPLSTPSVVTSRVRSPKTVTAKAERSARAACAVFPRPAVRSAPTSPAAHACRSAHRASHAMSAAKRGQAAVRAMEGMSASRSPARANRVSPAYVSRGRYIASWERAFGCPFRASRAIRAWTARQAVGVTRLVGVFPCPMQRPARSAPETATPSRQSSTARTATTACSTPRLRDRRAVRRASSASHAGPAGRANGTSRAATPACARRNPRVSDAPCSWQLDADGCPAIDRRAVAELAIRVRAPGRRALQPSGNLARSNTFVDGSRAVSPAAHLSSPPLAARATVRRPTRKRPSPRRRAAGPNHTTVANL
jgi:hypothetical protein